MCVLFCPQIYDKVLYGGKHNIVERSLPENTGTWDKSGECIFNTLLNYYRYDSGVVVNSSSWDSPKDIDIKVLISYLNRAGYRVHTSIYQTDVSNIEINLSETGGYISSESPIVLTILSCDKKIDWRAISKEPYWGVGPYVDDYFNNRYNQFDELAFKDVITVFEEAKKYENSNLIKKYIG